MPLARSLIAEKNQALSEALSSDDTCHENIVWFEMKEVSPGLECNVQVLTGVQCTCTDKHLCDRMRLV